MKIFKKSIPVLVMLIIGLLLSCCVSEEQESLDASIQRDAAVNDAGIDAYSDSGPDTGADVDASMDAGSNPDGGGAYQWHTFYGTGGEDFATDIVSDKNGNVFILGKSFWPWVGPAGQDPLNVFQGSDDITVLKLKSDGAYQWHTFYGSNDDSWPWGPDMAGSDFATEFVVDDKGNVYVIGFCYAGWTGPDGEGPLNAFYDSGDLFILKLDSEGRYQWHTFYHMEYGDTAWDMVVDETGNVYMTGNSNHEWSGPEGQDPVHKFTEGKTNAFLLKINMEGDYEWHSFYPDLWGWGMARDGFGDLFISGRSNESWNGPDGQMPLNQFHVEEEGKGSDACILKLSDDGGYLWHTFYGASGVDYGRSIVVDEDGNAYTIITGELLWEGPSGEEPIYEPDIDINSVKCLLNLTGDGKYKWHLCSEKINGGSLDINEKGEIFLAGTSYTNWLGPDGQDPLHENDGTTGYIDMHVIKLDKTGHYEWHTFYGSGKDDYKITIDLDENRGLWITGTSDASWSGPGGQSPLNEYSGDSDITILKLRQ